MSAAKCGIGPVLVSRHEVKQYRLHLQELMVRCWHSRTVRKPALQGKNMDIHICVGFRKRFCNEYILF